MISRGWHWFFLSIPCLPLWLKPTILSLGRGIYVHGVEWQKSSFVLKLKELAARHKETQRSAWAPAPCWGGRIGTIMEWWAGSAVPRGWPWAAEKCLSLGSVHSLAPFPTLLWKFGTQGSVGGISTRLLRERETQWKMTPTKQVKASLAMARTNSF